MPRPPRFLLCGSFYHIITRGNNRNTIFKSPKDYKRYLFLLGQYKNELPFDLYHYCLMPNHVHLLIQTKNAQDFSLFVKKINLSYFHYYKKLYGWIGHFWQDRYRSQPVGKDEYFLQCGKYIELNPVRAKLVKSPGDYPYSSYRYYTLRENNPLVTQDIFYDSLGKNLGERQRKYQELLIDEIVLDNYKKQVWGSYFQRNNEGNKLRYHIKRK